MKNKVYLIIIPLIIIIISLLILAFKPKVTEKEFSNVMKDNNYLVSDVTKSIVDNNIIKSYLASKNNYEYSIEYLEYIDDGSAREKYYQLVDKNSSNIDEKYIKTTNYGNHNRFVLEKDDIYQIISRIKNTIISAKVKNSSKKEVDKIFDLLNY